MHSLEHEGLAPSPGGLSFRRTFVREAGRMIRYIVVRSRNRRNPRHNTVTPGSPSRLRPRKPPNCAIQRTACRSAGRRGAGWPPVNRAIQRFPFRRLQHHPTRHIGHPPRQQGDVQEPPGDHAVQGQRPLQPCRTRQLPRLDATATLEHLMPDLDPPPRRVPGQPRQRIRRTPHRTSGQQQPLHRCRRGGRRLFQRPPPTARPPASARADGGRRTQPHGAPAHRQRRGAGRRPPRPAHRPCASPAAGRRQAGPQPVRVAPRAAIAGGANQESRLAGRATRKRS